MSNTVVVSASHDPPPISPSAEFDDAEYGLGRESCRGMRYEDYEINTDLDFGDSPAAPAARTPSRMEDDNDRESAQPHRAQSENTFGGDVDMGFGPEDPGASTTSEFRRLEDERLLEKPSSVHPPSPSRPMPHLIATIRAASSLTKLPQRSRQMPRVPGGQYQAKELVLGSVTELSQTARARVVRGHKTVLDAPVTKDSILPSPRSSTVIHLLEIRDDPRAHLLPTTHAARSSMWRHQDYLVLELADTFMRPVTDLSAAKRRGASPEKPASKKRRLVGSVMDDEGVEQARRGNRAPSVALGSDVYGRASVGLCADFRFDTTGGVVEDFQMEIPEFRGPEG
ncbi:hypothetical protein V8D89_006058 [Ganoderma adspersum]